MSEVIVIHVFGVICLDSVAISALAIDAISPRYAPEYMTHAQRKIFIQLIVLTINTNNKTFINISFIFRSNFCCETGGHLLVVPRPARLAHSAATLLCLARPSGPFRRYPPLSGCQTGGHLLVAPRPARLAHSAATLLCLAARRAGIFWWFLGPPVWPIPPLPSSVWLPDGRASSGGSSARPSGPFRRYPPLSGCQTGGHLLVVPRPARLAHSAATLLCLAAVRAGIFWWLLGPPVWPIPPLASSVWLPYGRASSGGSSARPSDPFRRYPPLSGCHTGGHLLVAPRPALLTHSAATLLWLAAIRAGIFWWLLGPPFWPIPPLPSSVWLPYGRASSGGSSARPSDPFRRYPPLSGCHTGGHLLVAPRPALLTHSAATLLCLAARRAGIFWWLLGPPVWPIPPLPLISFPS